MDASLTFNSETLNTKVEFLVFFKSCHCFDFVHVTCFGLLFHFIFFVASSLIAFLCFSCMFKSVESDQKCQNVLLMQSTVTSPPHIPPVAAARLCTAFSSHHTRPSAHGSASCRGSCKEDSWRFD